MKKYLILPLLAAALCACAPKAAQGVAAPVHPEWTYNSVVYEVNIRQFSPEGTFKGVEAQLPRLKDLGVDVLWLMPMYEIGTEGRKGTLGSYYAISDYRKVNPEFGTMEDFDSLLASAHALGFKVILDWVANQTAPDHVWMTTKPADFYERDADGNAIWEYDWTDTRSLNYENKDVWAAQEADMRFWLEKGVDGFRCDAAGEVPAAFWKGILPSINADYPDIYLLAEAEKPELADAAETFDAHYAWELHHLLNDMAQGKKSLKDLKAYVKRDSRRFPKEAYRLAFTSNHDENSWSGSEFEREGEYANACAVLCATLPGTQLLVYTGQEIGLQRRLQFFEKDPITSWEPNEYTSFWKWLVALKQQNPALAAGEGGGIMEWLQAPAGVVAFRRVKGDNCVAVAANFGKEKVSFKLMDKDVTLAPAGYEVLVSEDVSDRITRVEPLSWWAGMKTPLQLMVQGPEISAFDVAVEGKGLRVKEVHKADSPNFLFLDMEVSAPGTYNLVFSKDGKSFKYPYLVRERENGSARRSSFTTADMIYLIMPDRFSSAFMDNDEGWQGGEYDDGSLVPWAVPSTPDKVDRNFYNGRHGGDIQGIINHLDYIEDLGATAIWCTPLLLDNQDYESYHGYACADYYHIDPRFGDNAHYKKFVDECHARGLKVIMDIVTNHCGTAHWWMEDAPFDDWYHVNEPYMQMNALFSVYMDPHASKKDRERQESGWFVPSMPDMNLDNPFVLRYFQQWAVWWTEYAGLDGLRVDTYPYNEPEPMSRWCKAVTDEYPNMNIVGECWDMSIPQLAYWQKDNPNKNGFNSNLPSIMDFPLQSAIIRGLQEDKVYWDEGMTRVYSVIAQDFAYEDLTHMLTFFANHDHARTGDVLGQDPARMKLALALLATVRGIPQLYYGDEMMFLERKDEPGHDGSKRIDFPGGWEGDSFDLFTAVGRAQSPWSYAAEIHDYARALFRWRKGCKAVQEGETLHFLSRRNEGPINVTDNSYSFFRYTDEDAVFVYINNNTEPRTLDWSHYDEFVSGPVKGTDVISGDEVTLHDGLSIGPKQALIVSFKR